jgi:hypothetical protein
LTLSAVDWAAPALSGAGSAGLVGAWAAGAVEARLDAAATVVSAEAGVAGTVEEAWLRWDPAPSWTATVGRARRPVGFLAFKSPMEFRAAADPFALASGGALNLPTDSADLTVYGDAWQLTASLLPLAPRYPELDPGSPWFPIDRFPASFEVPPFEPFRLRAVVAEAAPAAFWAAAPAWQVHGRLAAGAWEAAAGAYGGPDPEALYLAKLRFVGGSDYDIQLRAERRRLLAAFAGAAWTGASVRLAAEAAFVPRRAFAASLADGVLETDDDGYTLAVEAWSLDAGLGASGYAEAFALDWGAELRYLLADPQRPLARPALAALAVAYARRSWLDGRLSADLLAAATPALDDRGRWTGAGYAAALGLRWSSGPESEFGLTLPLFGGDPASDLGRYWRLRRLSLSATLRR